MDFFEAVKKRRSIRKFSIEKFPDQMIEAALNAALLAPNSSNVQNWDFHWVKSDANQKNSCMPALISRLRGRPRS